MYNLSINVSQVVRVAGMCTVKSYTRLWSSNIRQKFIIKGQGWY